MVFSQIIKFTPIVTTKIVLCTKKMVPMKLDKKRSAASMVHPKKSLCCNFLEAEEVFHSHYIVAIIDTYLVLVDIMIYVMPYIGSSPLHLFMTFFTKTPI